MSLGVHTQLLVMRIGRRSSMFHTYITHEGKKYKLMIDGGSYVNIIAKIASEKMSLKVEPHPHPYNVNWVYKTAQPITQCCQIHIHMSNYEDHVSCDILDIDIAYILLGRAWLYNLDVISQGRYNTHEFKLKKKE